MKSGPKYKDFDRVSWNVNSESTVKLFDWSNVQVGAEKTSLKNLTESSTAVRS